MSDATSRRVMAEIRFGEDRSGIAKVGSRSIHQYWNILSPHFRDVLLAPQRRSDDGGVSWTWRESTDARPLTTGELAGVRKRLEHGHSSFEKDPVSPVFGEEIAGGLSTQALVDQVAARVKTIVANLSRKSDSELAHFVCRTETGPMVHSWGVTTPATPFYPDSVDCEIRGVVIAGDRPSRGHEVVIENARGLRVARFESGESGEFRFSNLGPGRYRVRVLSDRTNFPLKGVVVILERGGSVSLELRSTSHVSGNRKSSEEEEEVVVAPAPAGGVSERVYSDGGHRRSRAALWSFVTVVVIALASGGVWWMRRASPESNTQSKAATRAVAPTSSSPRSAPAGATSTIPRSLNRAPTQGVPAANTTAAAPRRDATAAAPSNGGSGVSSGRPERSVTVALPSAPALRSGETVSPAGGMSSLPGSSRDDAARANSVGVQTASLSDDIAVSARRNAPSHTRKAETPDRDPVGSVDSEGGELPVGDRQGSGFAKSAAVGTPGKHLGGGIARENSRGDQRANGADAGLEGITGDGKQSGGEVTDERIQGSASRGSVSQTAANSVGATSVQGVANAPQDPVEVITQEQGQAMSGESGERPVQRADLGAPPRATQRAVSKVTQAAVVAKEELSPQSVTPAASTVTSSERPFAQSATSSDMKISVRALQPQAGPGEARLGAADASPSQSAPVGSGTASEGSSLGSASAGVGAGNPTEPTNRSSQDSDTRTAVQAPPVRDVAPADTRGATPFHAKNPTGSAAADSGSREASWLLVRVARWLPRPISDLIVPTVPVPVAQADVADSDLEKFRRERLAKLPSWFRTPTTSSGCVVELPSEVVSTSNIRWRDRAGVELAAGDVRGRRAELTWSSAETAAAAVYVLCEPSGPTFASVTMHAAGEIELHLAPDVRGAFWVAIERKSDDRSTASGAQNAKATWWFDGEPAPPQLPQTHEWRGRSGFKIELPVNLLAASPSVLELALVDEESGWGLVTTLSLQASR